MSQARPALTREEALKLDYFEDCISQEAFERAAEAIAQLGIMDEPCPYDVEFGFAWWKDVPVPHPFGPGSQFPIL